VLHQQNVFLTLGASRSVWEEGECKLRSANSRRESHPRRAFRPAFRVPGISDALYWSTIGADVISLGARGTIVQPIRESQTNSERWLGSYGYLFKGLQGVSDDLWMYMTNNNALHIVIATGPGDSPAVLVWTRQMVQFSFRTVQKPDLQLLGRPNLYLYQLTRGFCRIRLDPSVPISGSYFRDFLFMVTFRYSTVMCKILTLVHHCFCLFYWLPL